MLKEYRVVWQQQPYVNHARQINFVMAESEANATALIKDHIERVHGISMKTIHSVVLYDKPAVGYVK